MAPLSSIQRVESADRALAAAIEERDPARLLRLCGDLLRLGDAGYDKLISLFSAFTEQEENADAMELLQELDESYLGVALRIFTEHEEEVLRFCLYLVERSPETLPEPLRNFREQFPHLATLLLGFHADRNPELLLDTIAVLRSQYLEGTLTGPTVEYAIEALAHVHLEESTELLLQLLDRAPVETLPVVVKALGQQGNPRALSTLETLKIQFTEPPVLVRELDQAIALLSKQ